MIKLAFRQFRVQLLIAVVGLAAVTAIVLATRGHLQDVYDATVGSCVGEEACEQAARRFLSTSSTLRGWLSVVVLAVPGLVGLFWGAPLVARELEAGTFRLVWTQSVSRRRWLLTKLTIVGAASAATAGLASWAVTWWSHLFVVVNGEHFDTYDVRDIVPIGHALFVFALGVLAGATFRKVLPALGTSLVVFIAVRLVFANVVRPRLLTSKQIVRAPDAMSMGFGSTDGGPGMLEPGGPRLINAWVHSVELVDSAGREIDSAQTLKACPQLADLGPPRGGPAAGATRAPKEVGDMLRDCVATIGKTYQEITTYHAADRYWPLQWLELGIYVGAAFLLVGATIWWVRRSAA